MTEENKTVHSTEEAENAAVQALPAPQEKRGFKYMLRDILGVVVSAVVIAMVLKTFIMDSRVVPTTSMYPTIAGGDRVIIVKFPYYLGGTPARQDVVVFAPGEEFDNKDDLLKRVIGLPGDTVEVKEGKVYVNGEALIEPYVNEPPVNDYGPITVPEDHYFMMGDNRNNSNDSRRWADPFVPFKDIRGKVVLCFWPAGHIGIVK